MDESIKDFFVRRLEEELLKAQMTAKTPTELVNSGKLIAEKILLQAQVEGRLENITQKEIDAAEIAATSKLIEIVGEFNFNAAKRLLDDQN